MVTGHNKPLVCVVTPVYNGGPYLRECIESVLAQTYSTWEYTIVNNCSTDESLDIAEQYAARDKRIRVFNNETLLDIIANHNRAFGLISPESKYCKVVSADDWLFPDCLTQMVSVAEMNPSVGLVGSYQLSGGGANWSDWRIKWASLPYPSTVIPGREICRVRLLGGPRVGVFGPPTSLLYRADLVRKDKYFYPNPTREADTSACYECLRHADFGFVHQVLSYERIHQQAVGAECRLLNTYKSAHLSDLISYGPLYLTEDELKKSVQRTLSDYYDYLAVNALHSRGKAFWAYHKRRLKELGYPFSYNRFAKALFAKTVDLLLNPKQTAEKVMKRAAPLAKRGIAKEPARRAWEFRQSEQKQDPVPRSLVS
jgi:glycosyltransferase involved in cell wall biosynthesis